MRSIQLHASSLLAGLAMALMLALICLPGMNLDQQVIGTDFFDADATGVFDHGWPAVYLTRKVESFPLLFHGPVVSWAPWRSWGCWNLKDGTITTFSLANLLVDIVVCLALVTAAVALWEYRRRRRASAWQITVREMFAVTFVMASVFGWLAYQRNESRREIIHIDAVHNLGDDLGDGAVLFSATSRPDLPVWIIRLIGPASIPAFLFHCGEVNVSPNLEGDYHGFSEAMPHLLELSQASLLSIEIPPNEGVIPFDDIGRLHQVDKLELWTFDNDVEESWKIGADDLRKLRNLDLIILPSRSSLSAECAAILEKEMPSCRVEFRDEE